jgi:hypothetical protein
MLRIPHCLDNRLTDGGKALKSPYKSCHILFREFIEYTFQFLLETDLQIINFILYWGMNVQNDDLTLLVVQRPITAKLNPL